VDFNKLIARVKNILLTPKTEWPVIAAEPDSVVGLYKNYILILAAIPAVIAFLRYSVFGVTVPIVGGTFRLGVGAGITQMIVTYVVGLAVAYLMMLIIDALAPSFGGQKNQTQALKSIAYAYTASWIASILALIGGSIPDVLAAEFMASTCSTPPAAHDGPQQPAATPPSHHSSPSCPAWSSASSWRA
jgi:hypothetical protein